MHGPVRLAKAMLSKVMQRLALSVLYAPPLKPISINTPPRQLLNEFCEGQ